MSTPALQALFPEVEAPGWPPAVRSNSGATGQAAEPEDSFLVRLRRMTPRQRVQASRDGSITRHERAVWACRYPDEVPLVNGEFEWIALSSADAD